ncbi:polymorphic toxin type 30 domain-containing protein, partial [Citrobacter sedlakii]|uniref:polymorphic toxin type 30 domain-containing protein n=1 Tax=Citrobacter sedlakii TaxID=67826 RepID=UPI001F36FA75
IGLAGGINPYGYVVNPLNYSDPLGLACVCPGLYDWYKYNRSQGITAIQAYQAIKNSSPLDIFNYALHRQGLSGHNYPMNFKEKFTAGNYKYEVRAHDVNPNAPPGSNSANGPIYRVGRSQSGTNPATNQGYGWEYGSHDGNWHHTSTLKPNSPNYNPGAANDTHIPLPTRVVP